MLVLSTVFLGSTALADTGDPGSTGTTQQQASNGTGGGSQGTTAGESTAQPTNDEQQTNDQQSTDGTSTDAQSNQIQSADAQPAATCPAGRDKISGKHYVVNGTTTYTLLHDHLQSGDHVVAHFTVADGCTDVLVQFVAFKTQGPNWVAGATQKIASLDKGTFGPGEHTLAIDVPPCYFQVDLTLIEGGQHLIMATDTGGTQACDQSGNTPPPPDQGNTGVTPPPEVGGETVTPPSTGGETVTPPSTGGETVTPPSTGGETVTPPSTGGETVTPPEVGGETVTPPVQNTTTPTPETAPVVLPSTIERPAAQPATQPANQTAVLGNEVTRVSPAQARVGAASLARTGSSVELELAMGVTLLLLGAALVEAGRRRAERIG